MIPLRGWYGVAIAGWCLIGELQQVRTVVFTPGEKCPYGLVRNGEMGAVVDAQGLMRQVFWPGFGVNNQLGPEEAGVLPSTTQWGLVQDGGVTWQSQLAVIKLAEDAEGPGLTRRAYGDDGDAPAVMQEVYVHPEQGVVVIHLIFNGPEVPERVLWYQNLDPGQHVEFGSAWLDRMLAPLGRDFAAFADEKALRAYQFRPDGLTPVVWKQARELAGSNSGSTDWHAFGDGVWSGVASGQAVGAGTGDAAGTLVSQAEGVHATVGDGRVMLTLQPDSRVAPAHCTIYLAFGAKRESVDALLEKTLTAGDAVYREACVRSWDTPGSPPLASFAANPRLREAVSILRSHTDREKGNYFVLPDGAATLPVIRARSSVLAAAAYAELGEADLSARILQGVAGRAAMALGHPEHNDGVPSAWHLDGTPAYARFLHDPGGAAWLLGGIAYIQAQHPDALDAPTRAAVQDLGDYLATWCASPAGGPYPSFNGELGYDAVDDNAYLLRYMGLYCAVNLLRPVPGAEPEIWGQRLDALHLWIQQRLRHEEALKGIEPVLLFWMKRVIPPGERLWNLRVDTKNGWTPGLAQLDQRELEDAAGVNPAEWAAMVVIGNG